MHQTYRLDFLSECALDPERALLPDERAALAVAHEAFAAADAVVVRLGGKAGRLGESIVATGLLEGLFLALRAAGKAGIPIHLIVDAGVAELFDAHVYRQRLWPAIHVTTAAADQALDAAAMDLGQVRGEHVLVVDLHGAHDGPPRVHVETEGIDETAGATAGTEARHLTTLAHLARVGLREYAQRGPQRRYADFIEDLVGLPRGMLEGSQAQPHIGL
ncbi:MAG TPA: hypothetical protein VGN32_04425, partial [Ktedonobacterales bacterium]|nr:hypothetical protein [Ktedonobacterales bacterium]